MAAALTTQAVAEKRSITEKDLFSFIWIGDPQVSPDGARVAFVRVTVNEKKEGYNTSIWVVSTAGNEGPHRLTSGERDSSPRWSLDGKYLVFTRVTEKDGKPESPQLFMLSMAGGDAFSNSVAVAPNRKGKIARPPSPNVKASGGEPTKTSSSVTLRTYLA